MVTASGSPFFHNSDCKTICLALASGDGLPTGYPVDEDETKAVTALMVLGSD